MNKKEKHKYMILMHGESDCKNSEKVYQARRKFSERYVKFYK